MKRINDPSAILSALIASGDVVDLGNITEVNADIVNIEQARNKFTMTAQISQEERHRIQQLFGPLKKADEMAAELNNMQQTWTDKIKFMDRRTRRKYERQFRALAKQFKAHCTKNGINYTIQK